MTSVEGDDAGAVVEVQMGKHHVGDVIRFEAVIGQGLEEASAVIIFHFKPFAKFIVDAVSHSGVHEDGPPFPQKEEATHGHGDAVHVVGGNPFLPHGFGDDAEH